MAVIEQFDDQRELLQGFVTEGREMLDDVEPYLIELEKISEQYSSVDSEVVNTIFRLFHSLKGGAGFLDLETIQKITHEAETLLDLFRKGKAVLTSGHIDLLNRTCDFIRRLLDNVENRLNDKGFGADAAIIIEDLHNTIDDLSRSPAKGDRVQAERREPVPLTTVNTKEYESESEGNAAAEIELVESSDEIPLEATEILDELKLTITPEMVKQFTNESEELLETTEEALLKLEKEPDNHSLVDLAFRALHSFKGNAGFLGYEDLEKLSHQSETILDKIRDGEISGDTELFSLLLEILDFLRGSISQLNDGKEPKIPSLHGLMSLLQASLHRFQEAEEVTGGDLKEPSASQPEAGKFEEVQVSEEPSLQAEIIEPKPANAPVEIEPMMERRRDEDRRDLMDRRGSAPASAQRQSIRVDVGKLDELMDLMGELVIVEAMVAQSPDLMNLDRELVLFEKSIMQLDKITRDLQDIATSIRMIPISATFKRMIRLVRDLSQKAGKKVELELIGEETEVDKTVIERITDPLIHIVRNAIDHGVGTREERELNGKPAVGLLTLEAKHVGGEVWITIRDDGKGLNREKIFFKAREKGIIKGDISDLTDEDVCQLIFQPGFSTADKVTDVSGRGVGMDVVRRNIENIRGKVEVQSKDGKGTIVIMKIPLTLAIIDGMIVRVGQNRYTIPIMDIKESLRVESAQITRTMDGQEIVNIRGVLLPVVRINELFDTKMDSSILAEGIIIIVENEGKKLSLFVDELVGQQQIVIKGLSEYVGNIKCVSGCTILGDGTVSPIIDIASIIAAAENKNE